MARYLLVLMKSESCHMTPSRALGTDPIVSQEMEGS
jgi:hypothetical protein